MKGRGKFLLPELSVSWKPDSCITLQELFWLVNKCPIFKSGPKSLFQQTKCNSKIKVGRRISNQQFQEVAFQKSKIHQDKHLVWSVSPQLANIYLELHFKNYENISTTKPYGASINKNPTSRHLTSFRFQAILTSLAHFWTLGDSSNSLPCFSPRCFPTPSPPLSPYIMDIVRELHSDLFRFATSNVHTAKQPPARLYQSMHALLSSFLCANFFYDTSTCLYLATLLNATVLIKLVPISVISISYWLLCL